MMTARSPSMKFWWMNSERVINFPSRMVKTPKFTKQTYNVNAISQYVSSDFERLYRQVNRAKNCVLWEKTKDEMRMDGQLISCHFQSFFFGNGWGTQEFRNFPGGFRLKDKLHTCSIPSAPSRARQMPQKVSVRRAIRTTICTHAHGDRCLHYYFYVFVQRT